MVPPSSFHFVTYSIEHNDGGANCFITNDSSHFTSYHHHPVKVKLLNGSTAHAQGFGIKLIQCPTTKTIIPLWPNLFYA
jgi:hypothetical protein